MSADGSAGLRAARVAMWPAHGCYDVMVPVTDGSLDMVVRPEVQSHDFDSPPLVPVVWRVVTPPSAARAPIRAGHVLLSINGYDVGPMTTQDKLAALINLSLGSQTPGQGWVHLRFARAYAPPAGRGVVQDDAMRRMLGYPTLQPVQGGSMPQLVKCLDGAPELFKVKGLPDAGVQRYTDIAASLRAYGPQRVNHADKDWYSHVTPSVTAANSSVRTYAQVRFKPHGDLLATLGAEFLAAFFGPAHSPAAAQALGDIILLHSFGTRAAAHTSSYRHMASVIAKQEELAKAAAAAGDVAGVLAALGPGSPACVDGWTYGGCGYLEMPRELPLDFLIVRGVPPSSLTAPLNLHHLLNNPNPSNLNAATPPLPHGGAAAANAQAANVAQGRPVGYPFGPTRLHPLAQTTHEAPAEAAALDPASVGPLLTLACNHDNTTAVMRHEVAALPGLALLRDRAFRAAQFPTPQEVAAAALDSGEGHPGAEAEQVQARPAGPVRPGLLWGLLPVSPALAADSFTLQEAPGAPPRPHAMYWLVDPQARIPKALAPLGAGALTDVAVILEDVFATGSRGQDMRLPPHSPAAAAGVDRPHASRFRSLPPTTLVNFVVQPVAESAASSGGSGAGRVVLATAAPPPLPPVAAAAAAAPAPGSGTAVALFAPGAGLDEDVTGVLPGMPAPVFLPPLAGDVSSLPIAQLRRHQARLRAVAGGPGPTRHGLFRGVVPATPPAVASFAFWTAFDEIAVARAADAVLARWAPIAGLAGAGGALPPLPPRRPCTDPSLTTVLLGVYPTDTQAALAFDRRARRGVIAALAGAAAGRDARAAVARSYLAAHAAALARGQLPLPHDGASPAPLRPLPLPTNFAGATPASWGAALTLAAFNVSRGRPELFGLFVGDGNVGGTLFGPGVRDSLPSLHESTLQRKAVAWAAPAVRAAVTVSHRAYMATCASSGMVPPSLVTTLWDALLTTSVNPVLAQLNSARNLMALVLFGPWLSLLPELGAGEKQALQSGRRARIMALIQSASQALASYIRIPQKGSLPQADTAPASVIRRILDVFPDLPPSDIASPRMLTIWPLMAVDAPAYHTMANMLRQLVIYGASPASVPKQPPRTDTDRFATLIKERAAAKKFANAGAMAGRKRRPEYDADGALIEEHAPPPKAKPASKPKAPSKAKPAPPPKPVKPAKEVAAPTRVSTRVRKAVQRSDVVDIDEALAAGEGDDASDEEAGGYTAAAAASAASDDDDEEMGGGGRGSAAARAAPRRGRPAGRGRGRGRGRRDSDDEHDAGDNVTDSEDGDGGEGEAGPTGPRIDRFLGVRFSDLPMTPEEEAAEAAAAAADARTMDEDAQEAARERRQLARRMQLPPAQRRDWTTLDYLIKYRDVSFLECEWVTATFIRELGSRNVMRAKKVAALPESQAQLDEEELRIAAGREPRPTSSYFDEDFVTVEKVLSEKEQDLTLADLSKLTDEEAATAKREVDPLTGHVFYHVRARTFLIKWRGLPYSDVTWEFTKTVNDDSAIAACRAASAAPTEADLTSKLPKGSDWKLLTESPVYKGGFTLRDYQLEGLNWLVFNFLHGRSSILADEMGLGKTVQTIAAIDYLWRRFNVRGPFLIVAPLSTLGNWKKEFDTWSDMNAVYYHDPVGGAKAREIIRTYEWYSTPGGRAAFRKGIARCNVIITSFQVLQTDMEYFEGVPWAFAAVDEAHALKSGSSQLKATLQRLNIQSLLLLTGTPLQNNVRELWSLLNLVAPRAYADVDDFIATYGELKQADQVAALQKELGPILLRRVKEDVERSIPPKEETVINVELTRMQKAYYKAIFDRNRSFLTRGTTGTVASLINIEMELRKCCNHPFLLRGAEERETSLVTTRQQHAEIMVSASGKMVLLDKLLPKLRAEGHRVLIFSQFKIMLDLLEELLAHRGYSYERIDGSVRGNDRQAAIDRFNKPESTTFAFLLSTKAGGQGINLTAADTVIIYDSDWNPQNDVQAMARVHRIGQTKDVRIYRLVTSKTYEAQMFKRASLKLGLSQAVFETGNINNRFVKAEDGEEVEKTLTEGDKEKMQALLRFGAYALMDEDNADEAADKFQSSTIDDILSASSTIRYDPLTAAASEGGGDGGGAASSSGGGRGGLNLSKATFAAEEADGKLDMKDPEFWNKLLGPVAGDTLLQTMRAEGKLDDFGARSQWVADLTAVLDDVMEARFEGRTHESWDAVQAILTALQTSVGAKYPHPLSPLGVQAFQEAKAAGSTATFLLPFPSPTISATLCSEAVVASQQRAKAAAGLCAPPGVDGDGVQHSSTLAEFATYWLTRLEEGRKVRARVRPVFAPVIAAAPGGRGRNSAATAAAATQAAAAAVIEAGDVEEDEGGGGRRRRANDSDDDFELEGSAGKSSKPKKEKAPAAPKAPKKEKTPGGGKKGGRSGSVGAAAAAAEGALPAEEGEEGVAAAAVPAVSRPMGRPRRIIAPPKLPLLEPAAVARVAAADASAMPAAEITAGTPAVSNIRIRLSPAFGPHRTPAVFVHGATVVSYYLMPSTYERLHPELGVLTSASNELQFGAAALAPAPRFVWTDPSTAGPADDAEAAAAASKAFPRVVERLQPSRYPRAGTFPARMPAELFERSGPTRQQILQAANQGISVRALIHGRVPPELLDQPLPPEELNEVPPPPPPAEEGSASSSSGGSSVGGSGSSDGSGEGEEGGEGGAAVAAAAPAPPPVPVVYTYRMREEAEAAATLRTAVFLVRDLDDAAALAAIGQEPAPLQQVGAVRGKPVVQFNTTAYRVVYVYNAVAKEVVRPEDEVRTALKTPPPWILRGLPFDAEEEGRRAARQARERNAKKGGPEEAAEGAPVIRKRKDHTNAPPAVPFHSLAALMGKWEAAPAPADSLDPPPPEGAAAPPLTLPLPEGLPEPSTAHEAPEAAGAPSVCDVCRAARTPSGEKVSRCTSCRTPVHATCYGKPAGAANFMCDLCTMRRGKPPGPAETPCRLCPCKGGAYKHALRGNAVVGKEGAWVHVLCAAWSPTAYFGAPETLSDVTHWAAALFSAHSAERCCVCDRTGVGECVPCAAAGCGAQVHPMCGARTGLRLQHLPLDMSGMVLASGAPVPNVEMLRLFCPVHTHALGADAAIKAAYRGGETSRALVVQKMDRAAALLARSLKGRRGASSSASNSENESDGEGDGSGSDGSDEEAAAAPPAPKRLKLRLSVAAAAAAEAEEGAGR